MRIYRGVAVLGFSLPLLLPSASAQHSRRIHHGQFDSRKEPAVVMINGSTLDPQVLKVKRGTTVEWINNSDCQMVDAGDAPFKSGILGQGASFRYTFSKRGSYQYHCRFRDSNVPREMFGTIIVTK